MLYRAATDFIPRREEVFNVHVGKCHHAKMYKTKNAAC